MHAIATTIIALATMAGTEAAFVEYDALTPETARALRSDVVPDYAEEAAREIVAAWLKITPAEARDTRIATRATQAWASAFRASWPAKSVAALAAQTTDGEG